MKRLANLFYTMFGMKCDTRTGDLSRHRQHSDRFDDQCF